MILCVYAIVAGNARVAGTGIAAEQLRVIRAGSLAAVVGIVPRKAAPARPTLIAYDAAIGRITAATTALLPARFGTFVAGDEEVAMILADRRSTLTRALAHVRNRVQMTIRLPNAAAAGANVEPGGRARPSSSGVPVPAGGSRTSGAEFLRARAAAAAAERHVPGFDPVRAAVARWVRDERVEKRAGVSSVYHLIPRAAAAPYSRAAERAAAARGLRLVVSGPFPPYAFAAL